MNFTLWRRITGTIVFIISTAVFITTVAPTLSFWDCGEFITASITMGVPHPPGAPFFQLMGKIFSMLPLGSDLGFRVNLISTFSSSLTVLFAFLIIARIIVLATGKPENARHALVILGSAAIGALVLSFSDTFWFNASEAEVYGIGMLFISSVAWIALEWYAREGVFRNDNALLIAVYLLSLSIGVHLLSLLALFFIFFLMYLRDKEWREVNNLKSLAKFAGLSALGFALIYPIVVKYIPQFLAGGAVSTVILFAILVGLGWIASVWKGSARIKFAALALLLVVLGYSTYTLVVLRANAAPALNENNPHNLAELFKYLNRDQYGDYPLLKGPNYDERTRTINFEAEKLLPRRWSLEHVQAYEKYSSDFDYFIKFQLGHIYLRYFLWNFVGRAGDIQDAPVAFLANTGDWSESQGYPNRYYAIPLILGLIGLYFHFRKDWRTATAMAALFLVMGIGLVVYFNMTEPQVRERDYFFIGSFFVFAIWIGVGVYAICDMIAEKLRQETAHTVGLGIVGALFILAPLNMLKENYPTHDRHLNFVAFDYAYNLLQSCDQDAILFTGGDNDTFPVWYLQYVAGVRRDVRVVNLSLVNTEWYIMQLKHEMPYGAKKVAISITDDEIMRPISPTAWRTQTVHFPVDPGAFAQPMFRDVAQSLGSVRADTLSFTVKSTYRDLQGIDGLRVQDMMILEIVKENFGKRPVYFALTTAEGDRIGIDEYLQVEGLAYKLVPFKTARRQDRYYASINTGITRKHLVDQRSTPDSTRAYGFLYRALNNPKVNLDEQSTRMIMSFRILYMALAQVLVQDSNDKPGAAEVLRKMETTFPSTIHKMDVALKTDLTWLYYLAAMDKEFKQTGAEIEKHYLSLLDADVSGQSAQRDPYGVLLNYYQITGNYAKGVSLMQRYKQAYPEDKEVDQQIAVWKQLATRGKPQDTSR